MHFHSKSKSRFYIGHRIAALDFGVYLIGVSAYGLKVLADLFAVRGHALKKCLFFRFTEGVRPYKPPYSRSAGSGQFVKAADPKKQTLLRLDPLLRTSN